jgi:hypothetical protein
MAEITKFPASTNLTVEQALNSSLQEDLNEVLIIGIDKDEQLFIRSSKMDLKNAFWMAELAKNFVINSLKD